MVSIIIPCYNYGRYVHECLESIFRQTYQNYEIIIVNDGSTDENTNTILRNLNHPKIRVIQQHNQGLAQSRNNGIQKAKGKYILPLDVDDMIAPQTLEVLVSVLENNPDIAYVYPYAQLFGTDNYIWITCKFNYYNMLKENHCCHCALIRKDVFDMGFRYNPNMIYGYEDWEYWIQLASHGLYGQLYPEPFFLHRRHGRTMTHEAQAKDEFLRRQIRLNNPSVFEPENLLRIKRQWAPAISIVLYIDRITEVVERLIDNLNEQTFKDFEILLASTTPIESFERWNNEFIRIVPCHPNMESRDRAYVLQKTKGKYIIPIDCKFLQSPLTIQQIGLEKIAWLMETRSDCCATIIFPYRDIRQYWQDRQSFKLEYRDLFSKEIYYGIPVYRRISIIMSGGYCADLGEGFEDQELLIQMNKSGWKIIIIPDGIIDSEMISVNHPEETKYTEYIQRLYYKVERRNTYIYIRQFIYKKLRAYFRRYAVQILGHNRAVQLRNFCLGLKRKMGG